jgi:hypothetical protein
MSCREYKELPGMPKVLNPSALFFSILFFSNFFFLSLFIGAQLGAKQEGTLWFKLWQYDSGDTILID